MIQLAPADYWKLRALMYAQTEAQLKAQRLVAQANEILKAHAQVLEALYPGFSMNDAASYRCNDAICTLERITPTTE